MVIVLWQFAATWWHHWWFSLAMAVSLWHCAETDDFCLDQGTVPQLVVSAGSSFGLVYFLYMSINSYGHIETVSSPHHTFTLASLTKWLTSTVNMLSLVTENNTS